MSTETNLNDSDESMGSIKNYNQEEETYCNML